MHHTVTWTILLLELYCYLNYTVTWTILLLELYCYLNYTVTWTILLLVEWKDLVIKYIILDVFWCVDSESTLILDFRDYLRHFGTPKVSLLKGNLGDFTKLNETFLFIKRSFVKKAVCNGNLNEVKNVLKKCKSFDWKKV